MTLFQFLEGFLITFVVFSACKGDTDEQNYESLFADSESTSSPCADLNRAAPFEDLLLHPTNNRISPQELLEMRMASRVCLPEPCGHLKAYSGFIPVDEDRSSYLFFLLIKATQEPRTKPLLLWLQGGPGKSSLFGQFLENGPLGINASGALYYRHHTLVEQFHVIYLDQPVGSGFSFDKREVYPTTLDQASGHVMRFLRRFLRLFPEYNGRSFYIAGESYGARSAIGVAEKIMTRYPWELPLHLEGVMLGVGFIFPLLELINSTDYLYYTGLLDDHGRQSFAQRFDAIENFVNEGKLRLAAGLLSQTVLNLRSGKDQSLYQKLTGFKHHGSVVRAQRPAEVAAYISCANSEEFKNRIHVHPSRTLDGTRMKIAMNLAVGDFFENHTETLLAVINNRHTLLYTAQLDAVFPAVNIERSFENIEWRGQSQFKNAERRLWYRNDNSSLELLGYEKRAGALTFSTVLFGGHYVSFDRSSAISDLYKRFLESRAAGPPGESEQT